MPRAELASAPEPTIATATADGPCGRYTRGQRLLQAREFKRVFDQPLRFSGGGLTVLVRPNELEHARLGLVISRKCAPRAVARNRIKRQIRESFRLNQSRLGALDIVVMGRPGLEQRTNEELRTALELHWTRLGQCTKKS